MKKIGSLNALYQENRIFYHCNACGDINVPGKPALYCGTVDDLPASVRELYENVWSEVDGWPEYVVTMDGKPCMAFSILVDKGTSENSPIPVLREKIALTPLHLRCAKLRRSPYRRNCPVGRYSMGRILTLAGMKSLSVWTRIWWRNTGAKF